jgi:uncharacterized protein
MGRLIFIVLIVALVAWLLRRAPAGPSSGAGAARAEGQAKGDLVSCAHCAVNVPKAEARSAGGRYFCSEEHWRLGPRDG